MAGKSGLSNVVAFNGDATSGMTWREQAGNWRPRITGPNSAHAIERDNERARSRNLVETDPISAGAIHVNVAHVVGTGLSMRANINHRALKVTKAYAKKWQDDVNERFEMWASSPNADVGGKLDFYDQQSVSLRSSLVSSDIGVLLTDVKVPGWPYTFATQLIESDRICNPGHKQDEPGRLIAGIEMNDLGRPIAAHIAKHHPGHPGAFRGQSWRRVEFVGARSGRRNLLHIFESTRPDQVRGRCYLSPVIGKLKDLSRYSEAEITGAVTAAALTVFTRMNADIFEKFLDDKSQQDVMAASRAWDGTLRPGTAVNLMPGEEVEIPANNRPSANFDPFFMAIIRQIAIGLELPFEVLVKHFTSSYTASRAAFLEAGRTFRRRRDNIAKWFCQPVYEEWLTSEILTGRISAPEFLSDPFRRFAWTRAQWIGDADGVLDPMKEIEAASKRVEMGISTLEQESIAYDGVPWMQKHMQRVSEKRRREKDGLELSVEAAEGPAPASPQPRAEPADQPDSSDDSDDDSDD